MQTRITTILLLLTMLSLGLVNCAKDEEPITPQEIDPCESVSCLNNGSCNDGLCDCPLPYIGVRCDSNLFELIDGTYALNYGEETQYVISVAVNPFRNTVKIGNLLNSGVEVTGTYNNQTATAEFPWFESINYGCGTPQEVRFTIESVAAGGNTLNLYISSVLRSCQDHETLVSRTWTDSFTRVSDQTCSTNFLEDVCVNNQMFISRSFGNFVFDPDRTDAAFSPPIPGHNVFASLHGPTGYLELHNPFNSGQDMIFRLTGYNQYLLHSNGDYRLNLGGGPSVLRTVNHLTRAYLTVDGKYLVVEAQIRNANTFEHCCDQSWYYRRL